MKALVEYMVRAIVDAPDEVEVMVIESGQTVVVELKVAKDDIGKVIGKQGNMARALRTIVGNAAAKAKKRAVLQVIE